MVHGLAGSAALAVLAVSTAHTVGAAIIYMALFGLGSIVGMIGLGTLVSVPFVMSAGGTKRTTVVIQSLASFASIALGISILMKGH